MTVATIKGNESPLSKIFSDEYVFSIPGYQRPYAWTTEHAGELLRDLLDALGDEDNVEIPSPPPYFLGSVTLIKAEGNSAAEVVDGQQRITTLTILLSALRRIISDEEWQREIAEFLMQKGRKSLGIPDRPRLTLRPRDAGFFRTYIQEPAGVESLEKLTTPPENEAQANIRQNAIFFVRELKQLPAARCVRLLQYMMQQCFLVVVSTPSQSSAFRIFSVLNDRGLDLATSDILKSDLLTHVPEGQQRQFEQDWEEVESELGRDAFQVFFAHVRMIFTKRKPKGSVLDEFRTEVVKPQEDVAEFIRTTLFPYADAYATVLQQGYQNTDKQAEREVNKYLRWLVHVDNVDWLPPAIVYLQRYEQEPARLVEFFSDLERLAASMMIRRVGINGRIERHALVLDAIEKKQDLRASSSPLQLMPDERHATVAQLDGDIYLAHRLVRRLVLWRLNELLSVNKILNVPEELSIEHVLPQTVPAGSVWEQWYPTTADRKDVTHRVGNLVLLTRRKNSEASNLDFSRKVQTYFAPKKGVENFALTIGVLQERDWTKAAFLKRQKLLVDALKDLWRL